MELKTPPWKKQTNTDAHSHRRRYGRIDDRIRANIGELWLWQLTGNCQQQQQQNHFHFFRLPFCHIFIFHFPIRRCISLSHIHGERKNNNNNIFARKGNFLDAANRISSAAAAAPKATTKYVYCKCRYIYMVCNIAPPSMTFSDKIMVFLCVFYFDFRRSIPHIRAPQTSRCNNITFFSCSIKAVFIDFFFSIRSFIPSFARSFCARCGDQIAHVWNTLFTSSLLLLAATWSVPCTPKHLFSSLGLRVSCVCVCGSEPDIHTRVRNTERSINRQNTCSNICTYVNTSCIRERKKDICGLCTVDNSSASRSYAKRECESERQTERSHAEVDRSLSCNINPIFHILITRCSPTQLHVM